MAEEAARAVIVLSTGKPLRVQQSVEELRGLIGMQHQGQRRPRSPLRAAGRLAQGALPDGDVSFFRAVDTQGKEHWVNVQEVVEFYEPQEHGTARFL